MSNAFTLDSGNVAAVAAELCGADLNLASLISRDLENEFGKGKGATIRVRVPSALPARSKGIGDKTTALTTDEISEQTIPVTLTDHVYSAVVLSEEDLSLDIEDFAEQVLKPQADGIRRDIERKVAAAMKATPLNAAIAYDAANPAKAFTALRKALRDAGVSDEATLRAAVGSNVYADLLDGPANTFDASGKVRGFEVHESTRMDADEVVAFVPEAFALVVRAPVVPDGAAYGASVKTEDFALRHVLDYDSAVAADRSLVSAFIEVTPMPLAVVDETDSSVDLVANAGAVRMSIGDTEAA